MSFLQTYSKEIAGLLTVVVGYLLNQGLRPKAKIVFGTRTAFTFLVDEPLLSPEGERVLEKQTVQTASIAIRNAGREKAENVEVALNWRPQFMNVWPPRHFEERPSPLGRHSIIFPSLAPKEVIQVELMAINANLPAITSLRSDQSVGAEVLMQPQQIYPGWLNRLGILLLTLGLATLGYGTVWLIQFVTTGVGR